MSLVIYPEYISAVLSVLRKNGFEAYIVGGSVRDSLLGLSPNDFDITTSALPEKTIELFSDCKTFFWSALIVSSSF